MDNLAPEIDEGLRCVLVPMQENMLVVPNTLVAEIVDKLPIDADEDASDWLKGFTIWRGVPVPVVRFEAFCAEMQPDDASYTKLVVFNTLNGNYDIPFIAIPATGIPSLLRITGESVIEMDKEPDDGDAVKQRVIVDGLMGIIPDIDVLENMLAGI